MKDILYYLRHTYYLGSQGWLLPTYQKEYNKYHEVFERLDDFEKDLLWSVYIAKLYRREIYCKINKIGISKFYRIRNRALEKMYKMLDIE